MPKVRAQLSNADSCCFSTCFFGGWKSFCTVNADSFLLLKHIFRVYKRLSQLYIAYLLVDSPLGLQENALGNYY